MNIDSTFLPVAQELIDSVFPTAITYIRNATAATTPILGRWFRTPRSSASMPGSCPVAAWRRAVSAKPRATAVDSPFGTGLPSAHHERSSGIRRLDLEDHQHRSNVFIEGLDCVEDHLRGRTNGRNGTAARSSKKHAALDRATAQFLTNTQSKLSLNYGLNWSVGV